MNPKAQYTDGAGSQSRMYLDRKFAGAEMKVALEAWVGST